MIGRPVSGQYVDPWLHATWSRGRRLAGQAGVVSHHYRRQTENYYESACGRSYIHADDLQEPAGQPECEICKKARARGDMPSE